MAMSASAAITVKMTTIHRKTVKSPLKIVGPPTKICRKITKKSTKAPATKELFDPIIE
jgi:hypothetical protein